MRGSSFNGYYDDKLQTKKIISRTFDLIYCKFMFLYHLYAFISYGIITMREDRILFVL